MACLPTFKFGPVDLPGLTIDPPDLAIDTSVGFCCKQPLLTVQVALPINPLLIAIPGGAVLVKLINEKLAVVDYYIDNLPKFCPKE